VSAVITASGLGKAYRRAWALRDCTLAIPEDHVVGLVGPNGAGKTTLLHLAAGLLAPTRGSICVLGERPAGRPARRLRAFGSRESPARDRPSVPAHSAPVAAVVTGLGALPVPGAAEARVHDLRGCRCLVGQRANSKQSREHCQ
jgi:ABC-type phosphate/phosphonate transport system ATPase subunit